MEGWHHHLNAGPTKPFPVTRGLKVEKEEEARPPKAVGHVVRLAR